jgi:hypothetical protein
VLGDRDVGTQCHEITDHVRTPAAGADHPDA